LRKTNSLVNSNQWKWLKTKKANATVPFDAIGEALAELMDIKRWLFESGIRSGNSKHARDLLDEVRDCVRCVREGLQMQLRDRSLKDMTPEQAQQAIYGCQILEDSLRGSLPRTLSLIAHSATPSGLTAEQLANDQ
jgi:hypothetical protein